MIGERAEEWLKRQSDKVDVLFDAAYEEDEEGEDVFDLGNLQDKIANLTGEVERQTECASIMRKAMEKGDLCDLVQVVESEALK